MKGSGVIGAYHERRVAPLMTRALPLYAMAPEASLDGTTLAEGALPNSEIVQRIKEEMEPSQDGAGAPRFCLPGAGASSDKARTRPRRLRKFPLFMPPLQSIS